MISRKPVLFSLIFVSGVLGAVAAVEAQLCEPAPDGFSCVPLACSPVPEDQCIGTVLRVDWATGAITMVECQCRDFNACHVEFGNVTPYPVGKCPAGQACGIHAWDADGDGTDDHFTAECVPAKVGVCCLDIDRGPVPYDQCKETEEFACHESGGVFHGVDTTCHWVQACCLPSGSSDSGFCAELSPLCCIDSGGIPQGPCSSCYNEDGTKNACGQICGGIAGIPCKDATEFCRLPEGGCCCDFLGVCTPRPGECPDVWKPVCGCDGVTYANECEAYAVGVSIFHRGACDSNCPAVWEPVCGVDGVTYANACYAELAGVPIAHAGECGQPCDGLGPHPPCPDGQFCKHEMGQCHDGFKGVCTPFPPECSPCYEPVCGCDCVTYPNECQADRAGVSIAHRGECKPNACCLPDGACVDLPPDPCLAEGGNPVPGVPCDVVYCGPVQTGACCVTDPAGTASCFVSTEADCFNKGGDYQGHGTTCPADQDVCVLPPVDGPCDGICPRFFYDTCTGQCESLAYGCCGGNANNFLTLAECVSACMADEHVCLLPPDPGACAGVCPRYFYNACTGQCESFMYGCCEGNANNFETLAECERACPPLDTTVHCGSATGACCLPNSAGVPSCFVDIEANCLEKGGAYQGDGTTCPSDPNVPCGSPCDFPCPPGEECFTGCGVLVQGANCVLFQADSGGLFLLGNLDGFQVGDRVFVTGCYLPFCDSFCMKGEACMHDNTIKPCEPQVCGGIAGIPCETPRTFCKFPEGSCGVGDIFGFCAPNPTGCPDEWDPVCGCDGVTYGNECEADAAGVSIAHSGECERVCGSWVGDTCEEGEFCKFPIGVCNDWADAWGVCTPIPDTCPEIYDPVCGCDGVTYDNECDADAAGVSVLHRGECDPVCLPTDDGTGCIQPVCSPVLEAYCFATVVRLDKTANMYRVERCNCMHFAECHIDLREGELVGVGACADGTLCQAVGVDTDNNGIDDLFTPECASFGACCFDVGGIPTPLLVCEDTPAHLCEGGWVVFEGPGTTCDATAQACCLPYGKDYCFDVGPRCCMAYGGVSQGPGSTCAAVIEQGGCPQFCGGIGGHPCGEGEFCKSPVGECGSDFQGICTPIPQNCPEYYDPVCGCDRVTYDNECFADAAGVSIAHPGRCEKICGGFAGNTCNDDEFCKFPEGVCNDAVDHTGICVPIPGECPQIHDPVCGCDNVTYDNECYADRARVSVLHRGECEVSPCAATRVSSDVAMSYCPGVTKTIHIVLTPPVGASAVALDDTPPTGWVVGHISDGGTFDAVNGKVKWEPFYPPSIPQAVSYDVTPPADEDGLKCFTGTVSVEGLNQPICGKECLERFCCPHIDADTPRSPCDACTVGDCTSCDAPGCSNGQVTMCELAGYVCAWMKGCNDNLAGMTRAAYIWRNGECYCWDDGVQNWYPTPCADIAGGCCGGNGFPGEAVGDIAADRPSTGGAAATIQSIRADPRSRVRELNFPIAIEAPEGTSAMALEIHVPKGWKVTGISDGGEWDRLHHKIKWGPFVEDLSRTVTFTALRAADSQTSTARRLRGEPQRFGPSGLSGTVSFDGVNYPIAAD